MEERPPLLLQVLKRSDVPPRPGCWGMDASSAPASAPHCPWEKDAELQSLGMVAVGGASVLDELCRVAAALRWRRWWW